ncbi:MAG: glycosyl hydrolase-related protein [bacterium]
MTRPHQPTVHVVFTTHWDREWVQTFEQYRFRLVNLLDRVIEILRAEPEIRFVMDGQTIVLEDYLAVRPDQRARLQRLSRAGRILFGPWYVLADQFLEGPEATIRNLQLGFRDAAAFGGPMMEGYVPDSFGSIATLPLLLNGFGIRAANFGRGRANGSNRDLLFRWRWHDGSEVLALNRGYAGALGIAYPDIWRNLDDAPADPVAATIAATNVLKSEQTVSPVDCYYFSVGVDHMELRPGMSRILQALNSNLPAHFISSTPERYAADAAARLRETGQVLQVATGEMRGEAPDWMDLNGVLSTHAEIKRRNRACEIMLAQVIEPLAAVYEIKQKRPVQHHLDHAWRLLIQNHPHDSICACSRDAVIDDILARFRNVEDLSTLLRQRLMHELLPHPPADTETKPVVVLFNPAVARGVSPFQAVVRVPTRLADERFDLLNSDRKKIGTAQRLAIKQADLESYYQVNEDLPKLVSKTPATGRADRQCYSLLEIRGVTDFGQAAGFQTLQLAPLTAATHAHPEFEAHTNRLRNDLVELLFATDGSVTLCERATGRHWSHLGYYQNLADLGDTYDYQPLAPDTPLETRGGQAEIAADEMDDFSATVRVTTTLRIPVRSQAQGRATETETHRIMTAFTLYAGSPVVHVRVQVVNRALNHRLRVGFPCHGTPPVAAGGHFAVMTRAWTRPNDKYPSRPLLDFLHVGEEAGLGILVRGMYEYQALGNETDGEVLLTLFRSVETIGPAAGCNYPVEHAKSLGIQTAEFALTPSASLRETMDRASAYIVPVTAEGCLSAGLDLNLPSKLLQADGAPVVTCFKRAADGKGLIVRAFNPGGEKAFLHLRCGLRWSKASRVNLAEEPAEGATPACSKKTMTLEFQPYEVITLRLK